MLRRLLSFEGRAGRQEWWTICTLVGLAKLMALFALVPFVTPVDIDGGASWRSGTLLLRSTLELLFLWPLLAINLRRAHDRNLSGVIEAAAVVLLGAIMLVPLDLSWPGAPSSETVLLLRAVVIGGAGVTLSLQALLPGTAGDNRYGPPARPLPQPAT